MHTAQKADVGVAAGVTIGPSFPHSAITSPCVLTMDSGDTYEGAVQTKNGIVLPHGQGVWRSADGLLRYEGRFVQRWRDGYGRLCTPVFTLWARWRMDRPDLSFAVRVDYANGDHYCGFIEWRAKPANTTVAAAKSQSKFHAWAAAVQPVRTRWGELILQNGDTYVGEWQDDEREGFGCYVWATGSRYTGRFHRGQFSDVGTLFIAASEVDGCFTRLGSGGWRCGEGGNDPRKKTERSDDGDAGCSMARWPPPSRLVWDGVIVDGVWADGRCRGEAHVTLPGGARLSADWHTATSPMDGELVLPTLTPQGRVDPEVYEWHESFQWESLFNNYNSGHSSGHHSSIEEKVLITRVNIQQSNSAEFVRSCVVELLTTHEFIRRTLHVFRRCFYALYGTCGEETETGAGSSSGCGGGNGGLGWCGLRNQYGGCVHRARGRPIQAGDLDLALRDIVSLARSTVRWALTLLGPEVQTKVRDCGGEAAVGRWVADRVFQHCYPVLLNLYAQVYSAEEATLAASVAHLRSAVSLDDMGVVFARQSKKQAQLFDPYSDAVHCVEQLNGESQTLTKLLRVLVQWSREIDLSTRLTQASQDSCVTRSGRSSKNTTRDAAVAAGSADDLLPIHQYVLSQSRCAHLYAVTRLLADFAGESLFMEATSQEAFGVTTLQVCVLTLQRLHPWERDTAQILVPFAVALDRVGEAVAQCATVAAWACAALAGPNSAVVEAEGEMEVDAALVAAFMVPYVKLWVPRVVGWTGEHIGAATASFAVSDCDFTAEELALFDLRPSFCGAPVCLGCWLYAGVLLGSVRLRLFLNDFQLPQRLQSVDEVKHVCGMLRECLRYDKDAPQLRVDVEPSVRLIPSRLLRMEVHLGELLDGL